MSGTTYADALRAGLRGGSTTTGKTGGVTTVGQFLELYVVHFVITTTFVAGGIMLIDRYANNVSGPFTAWDDLFFATGALSVAVNVGFLVAMLYAWIAKSASVLERDDGSIHWLHAFSILAAAFVFVWGILALILTFSTTLVGSVTDDVEVAGYFLVLLSVVYCGFLVIRYITGLAGSSGVKAAGVIQPATSVDAASLLASFQAASKNAASSQPIFGGGSGSAAFGGIDLSGLQPSSMSTLPPTQSARACAQPAGYPIMMMPPMMMAPQPVASCADPNAIHIA